MIGLLAAVAAAGVACAEGTWFPEGAFSAANPHSDQVARVWYGHHLRAFGEPPLACGPAENAETYRFLWIRSTVGSSAQVRAMSIVVSRRGSGATVTARLLRRDRPKGSVPAPSTRDLTPAQWRDLLGALGRAKFWQANRLGGPSIDGDSWMFEGRKRDRYQVVARGAGMLGPFGEVGLRFLKAAGLEVPRP